MMSKVLNNILNSITHSKSNILEDPIRFEGLLRDILGSEFKREIRLVTIALKAKIIDHLISYSRHKNVENAINHMINKLRKESGLDRISSIWTTITWALGIGLLNEKNYLELINTLLDSSGDDMMTTPKNVILRSSVKGNGEMEGTNPLCQDSSLVWNQRGLSLHNQGKYQEAIECFDRGLSIDPQNYTLLSNKGLSLHNQGKYQEAIECFDRGLSIDPQDEFILRRKRHSTELLTICANKTNNTNCFGTNKRMSKYQNTVKSNYGLPLYLIVTLSLLSVIVGFCILFIIYSNQSVSILSNEEPLVNPGIVPGNSSLVEKDPLSLTNDFDKESVSSFTEDIKKNLYYENEITFENHSTSKFKEGLELNSESVKQINENTDVNSGINFQMNQFKTELEKAMVTTFN